MISTTEVLQVEGNPEIQQLLERWLERAKQGKMCFICVVGCDSPVTMTADYAGIIGPEFAAYTGMDLLKRRILDSIENRKNPLAGSGVSADRVYYNFARGPSSFDFLSWLVDAEMTRVREKAPAPLRVGFFWGIGGTPADCLQTAQRRQMFYNVVRPALGLIGAVEDPEAINGRSSECFSLAPSVKHIKEGEQPPVFRASEEAKRKVKAFLGNSNPVVITLRETLNWPHRNSNIGEWLKFAEYLEQQGESVLFLRDTKNANETLGKFKIYPEASEDLDTRQAIYEVAKMNMFVGNGPWVLALFGKSPWMMFAKPDENDPCFPNTPEGFKHYAGISPGDQYFWSTPDQRIIWEADTFDKMVEAWTLWQKDKVNG